MTYYVQVRPLVSCPRCHREVYAIDKAGQRPRRHKYNGQWCQWWEEDVE